VTAFIGRSRAVSLILGAGLLAVAAASSARAASPSSLTVYAVPTGANFIDHSDDRARGIGNNPFNVDTKSLAAKSQKKEAGGGPYPGDEANYGFKLYSSSSLTKPVGSATIYCTYNFNQKAECDALFTLKSGALFASGPIDFNARTFMLAVTGGTLKYMTATGQVAAAPAKKTSQRLEFVLG
jgi:hypothetical protein